MCKWYCMSDGPSTNLQCLHCGTRYCGACLYGEAGKMQTLIKCASCGKKPRVKPAVGGKPGTPEISKEDRDRIISAFKDGAKEGSRPSTAMHSRSSSTASNFKSDVFSRLTDCSKYPGTHKHRFDESGRGRGLWGRDSIPKGNTFGTPNALEIYAGARYGTE